MLLTALAIASCVIVQPGFGQAAGSEGLPDIVPGGTPPGSDICVCSCPQTNLTPVQKYWCESPCAGIVAYDLENGDMDGLPPYEDGPDIAQYFLDDCNLNCIPDCASAYHDYMLKACECYSGEVQCDRDDDGDIDCSDLDAFLSGYLAMADGLDCFSREAVLGLACCFVSNASQGNCSDGPATLLLSCTGTGPDSIIPCINSILADFRTSNPSQQEIDALKDLTSEEENDILNCMGCCCETGGVGTGSFYSCDGSIDCDPNGDGDTDCADLFLLAEMTRQNCRGGEELYNKDDVLSIVCELINSCVCGGSSDPTPTTEEQELAQDLINCAEALLCSQLTDTDRDNLDSCIVKAECQADACCNANDVYTCVNEEECDLNCDEEIDCEDLKEYIARSADVCNGGVDYDQTTDRAELLELVETFLEGCDACEDLLYCLNDTTTGIFSSSPLTSTELDDLAENLSCDICDPKSSDGTEDHPGETCPTPEKPSPEKDTVELGLLQGLLRHVDVAVVAPGMDFVVETQITSSPEFDPICSAGEASSIDTHEYVEIEGTGSNKTLVIKGNASGEIRVPIGDGGAPLTYPSAGDVIIEEKIPGPNTQFIQKTSVVNSEGKYMPVWRRVEPGGWYKDFYRSLESNEYDENDPNASDNYHKPDFDLVGLAYQKKDVYGNGQEYEYGWFSLDYPVDAYSTGTYRLSQINLVATSSDGAGTTTNVGRVHFHYYMQGSIHVESALWGRLRAIHVYRDDMIIHKTTYTYAGKVLIQGGSGSLEQLYSTDVGNAGDLIQIVRQDRLDPVVGETTPTWRSRVTQFLSRLELRRGSAKLRPKRTRACGATRLFGSGMAKCTVTTSQRATHLPCNFRQQVSARPSLSRPLFTRTTWLGFNISQGWMGCITTSS
ncbi:MAG: hypothetical protein AAF432_03250 [Planctomycetota bacterium]